MKNDIIAVFCLMLICATLMLGVMGIYRAIGARAGHLENKSAEKSITSITDELSLFPDMPALDKNGYF